MRVAVRHTTRLDYSGDVTQAVMEVRLGPFSDQDQQVEQFDLHVKPHGFVRRYVDGFSNAAHLVTVSRPHSFIELVARLQVQTFLDDPFQRPRRPPSPLEPAEITDYLQPSLLVDAQESLGALAREALEGVEDADPLARAQALMSFVHRTFAYRPDVTDVQTTVAGVLQSRAGVCQDLAHVLIGLFRGVGIPARYASGYIVERDPTTAVDDGQKDLRPHLGGRASHAWAEAFLPDYGWRGFDPTNDLVANDYYVKVALGRDYRDVAPTRGTYQGSAEETLSVEVRTRVLG